MFWSRRSFAIACTCIVCACTVSYRFRLRQPNIAGIGHVLETMPNGDVLFSFGNEEYLPFLLHWICNTMHWNGVHERTLLVLGDRASEEAVQAFSKRVRTHVVPEFAQMRGFYSKGYRKLTIHRVAILVEILRTGRGVIMFEGDAVWTRNVLDDGNLTDPLRLHDLALYRDGLNGELIGAGSALALSVTSKYFWT